ncbi:MAG: type IV toxin-antitoxin system AbiEi family antitoxin domain-containing protein [Acidobacteriota bacterium]
MLASEGHRIFTTSEARKFAPTAGVSEGYLRLALHHLTRSGWLVRIRKGLYAISSSVPGVAPAHEFEIAMALVSPAAISHWSALHHHGLTDQVPRKVFVLTTVDASVPRVRDRKANRTKDGYPIDEVVYQFIQVKTERFFGTEKAWASDARVTITDPERTLLDGLSMPQYCGDFAEVLQAFELTGGDLNLERMIDYVLRWDAAMAKRLGWVLEKQGVEMVLLEPLMRVPIKGYRKLDPTGPRRGTCNRRWMIQENLPGQIKS